MELTVLVSRAPPEHPAKGGAGIRIYEGSLHARNGSDILAHR